MPSFGQTKHIVEASNTKFTPSLLEIAVGDTVEWRNVQGTHNVNGTQTTFPSNPESFGNDVGSGWVYTHVFATAGTYDYHCDPHANLGMVGQIVVGDETNGVDTLMLTADFLFMGPNDGQTFWLAIVDKETGEIVNQVKTTAASQFTLEVPGLLKDHSYFVDFYADVNGNNRYDAPPVDNAWRLSVNDVTEDVSLNFVRSTDYIDIMWQEGYQLSVHFMNMTPHVGQDFYLAVVDTSTGMVLATVDTVATEDFTINVNGLQTGTPYNVDFWADFNENGMYDTPPADHAWRMQLDSITGDSTLTFSHNTDFTDIMWQDMDTTMNTLTVHFTGMTPHVGQDFHLAVIDTSTWMEVARVDTVASEDFEIMVPGLETGMSYSVDFWADFNENGMYDAPPADHAWRMELDNVMGDTTLLFSHNTDFTDIMWKNKLTVHFMNMTPHVGQDFYLAVVDTATGMVLATVDTVASEDFMLSVYGLQPGTAYNVDFWADFNENGMYDAPPADHAWRMQLDSIMGDTTLMFTHNTDFTDIMWQEMDMNTLTVHFTGMTPHVGQDFHLAVIDTSNWMEVARVDTVASEDFEIMVPGLETGMSYSVDFWADFNENGMYDAPPADHAWRMELDNVMGDTTLMFSHNTDFTDIMWKNKLTVHFMNMTPHVGQDFYLAVVDTATGMVLATVDTVASEDFMLSVYGLQPETAYNVDFWADFNENGMYDAPPADHAWRMQLDSIMGDTTLMFSHNTDFTDIMWQEMDMNTLTVHFTGMTPHVGQDFHLAVIDTSTWMEVARVDTVASEDFEIMVPGLETGMSYFIDFWADFNENGMYDAPPADHAWRMELDSVMGDTTLMFSHNTDFTDIMWKNKLTVHFMNMTPHVGQDFYLAVVDTATGMVLATVDTVASEDFMLSVYGLQPGTAYNVDFWADFNENGMYDAPPADHAWRMQLDSIIGDTTLMFTHNTDFTDIMWQDMILKTLTVEFTGMTPHVGQTFTLYVVDMEDDMTVDSVQIEAVESADFSVQSMSLIPGHSYHINFWADFNENGMYDAPPVDHAWQLTLEDVAGDTTLMFTHNTDFTDIFNVTGISENAFGRLNLYPNPASDKVWIESSILNASDLIVTVYDITGKQNKIEQRIMNNRIELNVQDLRQGIYLVELRNQTHKSILKLIKQ